MSTSSSVPSQRPKIRPSGTSLRSGWGSWYRLAGRAAVLLLLPIALCSVSPASAGDVEIALQIGSSLPFYQQSFAFDIDDIGTPDIPISSSGAFDLELSGGLAISGAVTWRFSESLGLEGRVDSADVDLEVQGGRFSADLGDLIPGFPSIPISGDISGEATIDRLTPVSVNLQFFTGEKVIFVISGGVSYIPDTSIAASVSLGLRVGGGSGIPEIALPDLSVSVAATVDGAFGGNLGVGLRVPMGTRMSFAFDARAFAFPERELRWGSGSGSSGPIEEALAAALDPIEFQYGFFQATAGVAFTF